MILAVYDGRSELFFNKSPTHPNGKMTIKAPLRHKYNFFKPQFGKYPCLDALEAAGVNKPEYRITEETGANEACQFLMYSRNILQASKCTDYNQQSSIAQLPARTAIGKLNTQTRRYRPALHHTAPAPAPTLHPHYRDFMSFMWRERRGYLLTAHTHTYTHT